ncbi:MAG: lipopolysaccharide/colanic/teichoic acid biosynthesis glycosyltransferase [Verrucomicrobiales bacterium]
MRWAPRIAYWAGLFAIVLVFGSVHSTLWADVPYEFVGSFRFTWSLVLLAALIPSTYAMGLPEQTRTRSGVIMASLAACTLAVMVVSLAQLALGSQLLPRSMLGLLLLLSPPWTLLCWNAVADFAERDGERTRLFLIAEKVEEFGSISFDLEYSAEKPARLMGMITPDELSEGGPDLLRQAIDGKGVTLLVLDSAAQANAEIVRSVATLHSEGIRVRTLSLFYEEWIGKLPVSELERVSLLFDIGELHRMQYVRVRRIVDIACSALGAIGLVVLLPVVLLGNVVGNRGQLFFRQQRVGKDGDVFEMLKLRTMNATGESSEWTRDGDARITPFGNLLRRTHLDELPQVLNILRGELSIVGPRPEQVGYVEELRKKIPFYDARHTVRPGLTGWAQVKFGYASDEGDALEKLQYDMYYLRRQGIRLDLSVIVRTARAVLLQQGR